MRVTAAVTGAVIAGALAVAGWAGYQQFTEPTSTAGEVLRGYDATDPASTAPQAQAVFTGRVAAFEEQREIDGWAEDIYRVEVVQALRGSVAGSVRVLWAPEAEPRPRLTTGSTYVFATRSWGDAVPGGQGQLFMGPMRPVDETQLAVWRKAAELPVRPE
ncbi:hypothetical protein AB0C52_24020 [Streptomyces sp. NPDC048717]|uniref:hypothetical protein n=1 Tax=Streptomyces sp. NPDC048717 TaxID=3154928 RepID=UPI0034352246